MKITGDRFNECLGLFAGTLTTIAFLPQVIKVWKARPQPATAISLPMYSIFNVGVACWLIYGILVRSVPVTLANVFTLILALSVLVYKLIYG